VNLPEVDVVGLKPAQALFKHLGGERAIATMGTDLGHEEGLVTPPLETFAEPVLGLSATILPTTVIEGNTAVQSRMDKLDRGLFILSYTNMMSSGTESRDMNVGLTKTSEWNVPASFHATLMHICFDPVRVVAPKTWLQPCGQVVSDTDLAGSIDSRVNRCNLGSGRAGRRHQDSLLFDFLFIRASYPRFQIDHHDGDVVSLALPPSIA